jgi:hypothetical protein
MHLVEGDVHGPEVYYNMQTGTPRAGQFFWIELWEGKEKVRVNFCVGVLDYNELKRRSSNVDATIKTRIAEFVKRQKLTSWVPANNSEILLSEADLGIDFTKAG